MHSFAHFRTGPRKLTQRQALIGLRVLQTGVDDRSFMEIDLSAAVRVGRDAINAMIRAQVFMRLWEF